MKTRAPSIREEMAHAKYPRHPLDAQSISLGKSRDKCRTGDPNFSLDQSGNNIQIMKGKTFR